jgi:hypothetical protein
MTSKESSPDCFDLLMELYEKDPYTNYVALCNKNTDNTKVLSDAMSKADLAINLGNITRNVYKYFDKLDVVVYRRGNSASNGFQECIYIPILNSEIIIYRNTSKYAGPINIVLKVNSCLEIQIYSINGILIHIDRLLFNNKTIAELRCAHLTDD